MDYTEFINYIKDSFKEIMGGNSRIDLKTIIKNNDCELDALVIMEGEGVISPTIYLNDYYEEYKRGKCISDIISMIYKAYKNYKINSSISIDYFKDFSRVKNSIVFKVVNRDSNKKLLKDVPYYEYLDLAVVFYFIINTDEIKNATALIHNRYLEMWNVRKEALFAIAKRNTPRLLRYEIKDINDVINGFDNERNEADSEFANETDGIEKAEVGNNIKKGKMFVLTNNLKINGAACILYDDVIRNFAAFMGNDLYIIPSSVHEVILISAGGADKDELNHMVRNVNKDEVERYEILSDHIYMYDLKKDRILIP